jgi:two-component system, response regulator, stage 0 sporulation protein A
MAILNYCITWRYLIIKNNGGICTLDKKLRVAIADDSSEVRSVLNHALGKTDYVEVVALCENGEQVLTVLKNQKIDLLILDIIMPYLDGMGVLEKIIDEHMTMPEVIVLSSVGNEEVVQHMMQMGVRYYMVKPFKTELLVRRIESIVHGSSTTPPRIYERPHTNRERSLDETITSIFLTIGIPAHIKGYQFLRKGVKMVMEEPTIINAITKQLYPGIAKTYDTSASKVERAIRHAIEVAWSRGKIENINKIFGYNIYTKNDKPTNGEFIALVADKLSMENRAII